jgi:hypothetical protein
MPTVLGTFLTNSCTFYVMKSPRKDLVLIVLLVDPTAPPIVRDIPLETDVTDISNTSPEDYRRRHGNVAQVVTFDFKSQLQDLLGDKQIWGDPDNLLINREDNFAPYCNVSGARTMFLMVAGTAALWQL